jgi:hypothetical protein
MDQVIQKKSCGKKGSEVQQIGWEKQWNQGAVRLPVGGVDIRQPVTKRFPEYKSVYNGIVADQQHIGKVDF